MNELSKYQLIVIRVVLFFAAFCLLISVFLPAYRLVANGLILGSAVSCFNVLYMARKIRRVADMAATVMQEKRKRIGLGFGMRLLTSIVAIIIALKFPQYFNKVAVAASLVFAQFLLQIIGTVFSLGQSQDKDE